MDWYKWRFDWIGEAPWDDRTDATLIVVVVTAAVLLCLRGRE